MLGRMQRYLVHQYGGPESLDLDSCADPQPDPGEVRVVTRAIGINFADLIQRVGRYPRQPPMPFTPGIEAAGVIDAVGVGVDNTLIDRRVMAIPIYGSHAEKFCLPENYVIDIPEGVDFDEAAAFPVAFLTAQYALHELGRARSGETCVVTAAAGGVGTAILQLAKLAGIETLAVVSSPHKHDLVRSLGAAHVCKYQDSAKTAMRLWGGVDIVLDSVGGTFFRPHWKLLKLSGRYILYGFAEAGAPNGISYLRGARGIFSMGLIKPFDLTTTNRTLAGFNLSVVPDQVALLRSFAGTLLESWGDGEIRPVVGKSFRFERLPDAHRHLASRGSTGRVIVRCGD